MWGKNHVRTAAALAEGELTAVCDTDPKVRERLARQYPGAHVTGDTADLLGRVDAVVIASPAATHARLARQCIEAGKPCLVEKPFALSVRDAEAVARAAADARVPVVAGDLLGFFPAGGGAGPPGAGGGLWGGSFFFGVGGQPGEGGG